LIFIVFISIIDVIEGYDLSMTNFRKLLVILIVKKSVDVNNFSVNRKNISSVENLHILIMVENEQKTY